MKTRTIFLLFPAIFFLQFLFAQDIHTLEEKLDKLFLETMKKENLHQGVFSLEFKALNFQKSWAYGEFASGQKVEKDSPFHSASLGKTFTAVTIAKMVEEGKLSFEDPMYRFLPDSLTQGLHVLDGKDWTREITIAHLLQHRSGLSDYFEDQPYQGENMLTIAFEEPNKFWEPIELLDFYLGRFQAQFVPGTNYHYTDTEYLLLGLIIEELEQKPLHEVFLDRIFSPLGMMNTSMHLRSEPIEKPSTPMMEIYFGDLEVSQMISLSSDWAGGGLQSTSKDILIFIKALFEGKLIQKETLEEMQHWTPASKGTYYGFGLMKWNLKELFPLLPKLTLIGHSGFTGSYMYFCPELDAYLAGTFNQSEFQKGSVEFLIKVLMEPKDTRTKS
ncbi:D-alanyl-D-alanine carboxypeptidase [Algoriphagus boseongensis]|uniref:D-alanyl-D-alanine carboxypeptidase n=1 Tax=Algoriphagus boseongensis TaxID=1442587 RepID=A0A4R6T9M0_9BACT|nr:serine hydrolase domain-containing protein [Algoriphagus boseongensis]TDQ19476.1 D-alanyl-D-alanine carboxypeptidase [Algoriphagus boseongensis]